MSTFLATCPFTKVDSLRRIVKGPGLRPEMRDRQKTIVGADVIEEIAHKFAMDLAAAKATAGVMHDDFTGKTQIVETYITDFELNYPLALTEAEAAKVEANPEKFAKSIKRVVTKVTNDADKTVGEVVGSTKNAETETIEYFSIIPAGSWMLAMKIHDDATWERVLKGELRGFSIGGDAKAVFEDE